MLGGILGPGIDQVLLDLRRGGGQLDRHLLDVDDRHQHRAFTFIDDEQLAFRHGLQLGNQFRRQVRRRARHLATRKTDLVALHPGRHLIERLALVDHLLERIVHILAGDQQLAHVELLAIAEQLRVLVEVIFHFGLARRRHAAQFLLHVGLADDQRLGPLDGLHDLRIAVDLFFQRNILDHLAVDQRFEQLFAGRFLLRRRHAGALQFLIQLQRRDFFAIHAGERLAHLLLLVATTGGQAGHCQQDNASGQDALLYIHSFHFHRTRHLRGFNMFSSAATLFGQADQNDACTTLFQHVILQVLQSL